MNNFEAAVELSMNNWVASLPTEFDLPEPTEEYKKNIAKLMDKMRGDRYHRLTRSTARAILIAAIILALATVVFASTVGREYIVQKFGNYSTYDIVDASDALSVENIKIGYLPEGFELEYKDTSNTYIDYNYKQGNSWVNVYKSKISFKLTLETEHKNSEKTMINEFEGIYYENPNLKYLGLIWNNGQYTYTVEGNLSKEELVRIAESIT